jgi:Tfp pilus assembly protein PilF
MKTEKISIKSLLISVFVGLLLFANSAFGSTISGTVYGKQRNPLPDIAVELLNDLGQLRAHTVTESTGRYEFSGLGDGRFTVRVIAFRYDYMDQSETVEINTITSVPGQIGNGFFIQDFYLQPKKGSLVDIELGVVFAQEVPKEAQKVYELALRELAKKKTDEGIVKLREAIKIFPNYYIALSSLGKELFSKGEYPEAAQVFLKATEINPKSATSLYYLGNSLAKLNYNQAAIVALNQALLIAPSSIQVLYILGKTESVQGKYNEAEKHLVNAKKLSKIGVPEIHWELAQIYGIHLQKYKEAADELEQFLKSRPDARDAENIRKIIKNYRDKSNQKS